MQTCTTKVIYIWLKKGINYHPRLIWGLKIAAKTFASWQTASTRTPSLLTETPTGKITKRPTASKRVENKKEIKKRKHQIEQQKQKNQHHQNELPQPQEEIQKHQKGQQWHQQQHQQHKNKQLK